MQAFARYRPLIDDWEAFLAACRTPLPLCIWTNTLRLKPAQLQPWLQREGWPLLPSPLIDGAFRLPTGAKPGRSPAYWAGLFHVQEEVSVLPVELLEPEPEHQVLDLCAAPGNKTVRCAVRMGNRGSILANDRHRQRAGMILNHCERLGVSNTAVTCHDAGNLPPSCGSFDRVLADVPCSCEGTSRKNPRSQFRNPGRQSLQRLISTQVAILSKAVKLCRPGGRIVYSTCTYAPEENEAVIQAVLDKHPAGSLELLPAKLPGVRAAPGLVAWNGKRFASDMAHAMRIYPHHNDSGGFFLALLQREA